MKIDNLNDLTKMRINIEFAAEVLKLLDKEVQRGHTSIEHLSFMLQRIYKLLDDTAIEILKIETDEVQDAGY